MNIRESIIDDIEKIRAVHLQAFEESEAQMVADFTVRLLQENNPVKILSLVAVKDNKIIGHIAFSPVFLQGTQEQLGYILAPLAVLPEYQKKKVGSALIKHGIEAISRLGSLMIFVYGDPNYYSRFGFETDLARNFIPPFKLQYPDGWHAMKLTSTDIPEGGKLKCVDALHDPDLW
ncbi:MAG: N-acetyltransferase [Draconibacterium sp.]|nr:N-acetyltransferase [Draconibacterium sp.]